MLTATCVPSINLSVRRLTVCALGSTQVTSRKLEKVTYGTPFIVSVDPDDRQYFISSVYQPIVKISSCDGHRKTFTRNASTSLFLNIGPRIIISGMLTPAPAAVRRRAVPTEIDQGSPAP